MWIDLPNWQAASSFVEPVAPPGVEPDAAPLVCLQLNEAWLPYVIGSLMQLAQPAAWAASSPTALQTVLQQAQDLISDWGDAEGCAMLTFRFDSSCVLQFSNDGGTTWTDVPGWPTYAPGCYTGATGPAGPTGATGPAGPASTWRLSGCDLQYSNDGGTTWTTASGWSTDGLQQCLSGSPTNPPGVSDLQQACNIANWLAVQIAQGSLTNAAAAITAADSTLTAVTGIIGLALGFTGVLDLALAAAGIFFAAATAIGATELSAAGGDATLRSDLICAIYTAISADGQVTASNFSTVLANVNAISYGTPAIVGLLHDYLSGLGFTGVNAIQAEGSLFDGNCAGCGSGPIPGGDIVAIFNGTDDYLSRAAQTFVGQPVLTVMAWLRIAVVYPNFGHLISDISTDENAGETEWIVETAFGPLSILTPGRRGGGDDTIRRWTDNNSAGFDTWVHVAFSKPGPFYESDDVTMYINGSTEGWSPATVHTVSGATGQTVVGVRQSVDSNWYQGKMADLRVYFSVVSGSDIASIVAGGVTGYVPIGSPAHWWAFNDGGMSTSAHDYGSGAADLAWHGSGAHWSTV